jgi:hypothetical protein
MPMPVETRHMPVKPTIGATGHSGGRSSGSALRGVPSAVGTGVVADNAVAQASAEEEIVAPAVIAKPIPKPVDPVVTRAIESAASNPLRSGVQR